MLHELLEEIKEDPVEVVVSSIHNDYLKNILEWKTVMRQPVNNSHLPKHLNYKLK